MSRVNLDKKISWIENGYVTYKDRVEYKGEKIQMTDEMYRYLGSWLIAFSSGNQSAKVTIPEYLYSGKIEFTQLDLHELIVEYVTHQIRCDEVRSELLKLAGSNEIESRFTVEYITRSYVKGLYQPIEPPTENVRSSPDRPEEVISIREADQVIKR